MTDLANFSGAMTDAFTWLRIGGWYTVTYRNYTKTGEHIWVQQIEEAQKHLPTRVTDSAEVYFICTFVLIFTIYRLVDIWGMLTS